MPTHYDLIVVGAGMLGLAHAYHASKRDLKVLVLDRGDRARGASVRNFGMLATIAQAPGRNMERSLRTEKIWRDIADGSGLVLTKCGCLVVADTLEEMRVLEEFSDAARTSDRDVRLVSPADLNTHAPAVRADRLVGGLWAPDAIKIDQRSAMLTMAAWLREAHQVDFAFNTEVSGIDLPRVATRSKTYQTDRVIVCAGDEFATLFPDTFAQIGVQRCRLQMLRTVPQPADRPFGPFVLGGLSIARYEAFQSCTGMSSMKDMLRDRYPNHLQHGIHVIAAQEADGSVTIGDSHHYDQDVSTSQSETVEHLILDYLAERITLADNRIAERWTGHYAALPGTDCLSLEPQVGVRIVTMTNGQGMTHGLAIAEETLDALT